MDETEWTHRNYDDRASSLCCTFHATVVAKKEASEDVCDEGQRTCRILHSA